MAENQQLIVKYRPENWSEMVGHTSALAALKRTISSRSAPHAYLFTGPSGVGKTTLARILARELGADVFEADAASNNGVDDMREMIELGQHMAFSETGKRLFIIDECHMLTRNAWNAILKLLEEPPAHLYLALCTTERSKILETVITRCYETSLRPLEATEIEELLTVICELEEWKPTPDIMELAIQAAHGSPRYALTILQSIHAAPDREEARRIITLVEASSAMIELFQHLVSGKKSWKIVHGLLKKMEAENSFEEAMIPAGRYIATVLLAEERDDRAQELWQLLEAMVFPAETYDKKVAFIAAIGRILWGG